MNPNEQLQSRISKAGNSAGWFAVDGTLWDCQNAPLTLALYACGSRISSAAASPFSGSVGLGYSNSWGRNVSKTFSRSAGQSTQIDG